MESPGKEGFPLPGLLWRFVADIETLSEVFCRHSYISLVPSDWRDFFDTLLEEDVHVLPLLWKNENLCGIPPTLVDFLKSCESFSLNRTPVSSQSFFPSSCSMDSCSSSGSSSSSSISFPVGQRDLPSAFSRGMSPKKVHEVQRMAQYVSQLCSHARCSHVVDIGCGKAYFSQYLAFSFGLYVLGVEGNSLIQKSAITRTSTISKEWKNTVSDASRITYTATRIDSSLRPEDFQSLLSSHLPAPSLLTGTALCALHACGDLSSETLRIFVRQQSIRGLFLVGCCYNLLTEHATHERFLIRIRFSIAPLIGFLCIQDGIHQ
jgi:hypothetical protein